MTQREWDIHHGMLKEKFEDMDKHRKEDYEAIQEQVKKLEETINNKMRSNEKWSDNNSKLNKSLTVSAIIGVGTVLGIFFERITFLQNHKVNMLVKLTELETKVQQLELEITHLVSLIP